MPALKSMLQLDESQEEIYNTRAMKFGEARRIERAALNAESYSQESHLVIIILGCSWCCRKTAMWLVESGRLEKQNRSQTSKPRAENARGRGFTRSPGVPRRP